MSFVVQLFAQRQTSLMFWIQPFLYLNNEKNLHFYSSFLILSYFSIFNLCLDKQNEIERSGAELSLASIEKKRVPDHSHHNQPLHEQTAIDHGTPRNITIACLKLLPVSQVKLYNVYPVVSFSSTDYSWHYARSRSAIHNSCLQLWRSGIFLSDLLRTEMSRRSVKHSLQEV